MIFDKYQENKYGKYMYDLKIRTFIRKFNKFFSN
jgi:hypothetical protein